MCFFYIDQGLMQEDNQVTSSNYGSTGTGS